MDWSMPMDQEDRQALAQIRQRFTACCSEIAADAGNADVAAAAIASHLATMTTATLPPAAHPIWTDRVARALKAAPTKALAPRAIAALRSWPSSRVGDLATALVEIEAILADVENEALNVAIYTEISRAYS